MVAQLYKLKISCTLTVFEIYNMYTISKSVFKKANDIFPLVEYCIQKSRTISEYLLLSYNENNYYSTFL